MKLTAMSYDEVKSVIDRTDMNLFLNYFKSSGKKYDRYKNQIFKSGLDEKTVKSNLNRILLSIYMSRSDAKISEMIEDSAEQIVDEFLVTVNDLLGTEYDVSDVALLEDEQIADVFNHIWEDSLEGVDWDLVWLQLGLAGKIISDERKEKIIGLCNEDIDFSSGEEEESEIEVNETQKKKSIIIVGTQKNKKLSAKEKAEKNKAALEAKEKAKQEDIEAEKSTVIIQTSNQTEVCSTETDVKKSAIEDSAETYIYEEKNKMSKYVGLIKIQGNYYNFSPMGILEGNSYYPYSEFEIDELLPHSNKRNINFYYNYYDSEHGRIMDETFYEGQLVILNCEIKDLEENKNADGSYNQTGYKLPAIEGLKSSRISFLSEFGLYKLLSLDDLEDDISVRKIIRINREDVRDGEKILVNMGDGFYAGPYTVKYSSTNASNYIKMHEGKFCVTGYASADCSRVVLEPGDGVNWYNSWNVYNIKNGAKTLSRDIISDKALLESFSESIGKNANLNDGGLDVEGIMERLGNSQLIGDGIPQHIKDSRVQRLSEILSSEDMLRQVSGDLSNLVCELLLANRDSMQTSELIEKIVAEHPELIDGAQNLRALNSKVEDAQREIEQLETRKKELKAEIESQRETEKKKSVQVVVNESFVEESIASKNAELSDICNRLKIANEASKINEAIERLKEDEKYYENHKARLVNDTKDLESNFVNLVNGFSDRMADITFDGYMSSKMLQAAAGWEKKEEKEKLQSLAVSINDINAEKIGEDHLIEYLVKTVQIARPKYDRNAIINILTCITQGFLTVFAGTPGCGKTSICNIIAKTFGLRDYEKYGEEYKELSRYIPVSVERGWTSKRDFIGYYNPLTKVFEESNREVADGLRLLDVEARSSFKKWPFYILLDEANLSSMEYYWADFMNVCDDLSDNSSVNLGNDNVYRIPETLHFLATINSDHTTETLSPRLIDRAWVVTLPKITADSYGKEIPSEKVRNITWTEIKETFAASANKEKDFERDSQSIFDVLKDKLAKQDIYISPRVNIAIKNYWSIASELMVEDEYGNKPEIVALDYAIAQKILPKITGNGDECEAWLEEIMNFLKDRNMNHSAEIIETIIKRGNRNMKYYQFFE